jgi:hypothetical protein
MKHPIQREERITWFMHTTNALPPTLLLPGLCCRSTARLPAELRQSISRRCKTPNPIPRRPERLTPNRVLNQMALAIDGSSLADHLERCLSVEDWKTLNALIQLTPETRRNIDMRIRNSWRGNARAYSYILHIITSIHPTWNRKSHQQGEH